MYNFVTKATNKFPKQFLRNIRGENLGGLREGCFLKGSFGGISNVFSMKDFLGEFLGFLENFLEENLEILIKKIIPEKSYGIFERTIKNE